MVELCLGTVQFGMDYGIRNQKKPPLEDCVKMLDYATKNGIDTIDTAFAYGTAEDVVGTFLKRKIIDRSKLFISSKFQPNVLDNITPKDYKKIIREHLEIQLKRLNVDYLDAYLFHSSRYAFNNEMLEALYEISIGGGKSNIVEFLYIIQMKQKSALKVPMWILFNYLLVYLTKE